VFNSPNRHFNLLLFFVLIGFTKYQITAASDCFPREVKNHLGVTDANPSLPAPISKHEKTFLKNKVFDLKRLKKTTKIVNIHDVSKAKLPKMRDGTYVYAIDHAGHLGIVNRMMDPGLEATKVPGATFLGSHAGLAILFENLFGVAPQFVATGEVVFRNGRVLAVTSASGTYRGKTANFTYAIDQFRALGLPIDSKTQLRDYSVQFYDPHSTVEEQVLLALRFAHDPHLSQILDETRDVMRQLDRNLKDANEIMNIAFDPSRSSADQNMLYKGAHLFNRWLQPEEDEAYIVDYFLKSMGEEKFLKMLKKLSEAVPSKSK
jgi:hypothetical protein